MSCSADYYLLTCSQYRLVGADVCSAHTSRHYQNRKFTVPSQFGIVGAANWQRRLVCAEHTSAHTITTVTHSQRRIVGAAIVGSTDQAGCKHETILEKYIPTVNGNPSKMQSLIILSLVFTPLICVTVVVFLSLNSTSLIVTPLPE